MTTNHFHRERDLQHRIQAILETAAPEVDVLDVELDEPRSTVRAFIDHPSGVSLELCTTVTHLVRETCPDQALEVSSPGMERPLRKPAHFAAAIGSMVRFRRSGERRAFFATITAADDTSVAVRRADGTEQRIPFGEIVRSRLAADGEAPVVTDQPTTPARQSTTVRGSS